MNIGVAGTGRMGAAIAQRLIALGHDVMVWNRTRAKAKALAADGAQIAADLGALADHADVILSVLTDAAAIEETYQGPQGLLAHDISGKVFIEMSTVRPDTQRTLAQAVRAKGGALVECPVGGSVKPAREGRLLGLVGGAEADVERVRALLEGLCRRWEHLGPVGAGAAGKLAINLPLMVFWQAFGEALALVEPLGIDPARLVDLFADPAGGPNRLKTRGKAIAEELAGGYRGPVTFDVASMVKDLHAMIDEGRSLGVELPVSAQALACLEEARREGLGAADSVVVPARWAKRAARGARE